jgi:DNA ligase-associated metallophosphoesterase
MRSYAFLLGPARLQALPSGALFWPDQALLVVSDLHLGKAERMARRGGALLPPYENQATLERLTHDIEALRPAQVICLGDSFDDLAATEGLTEAEHLWLTRLMAGRDWVWTLGNHDAGPVNLAGRHLGALAVGGITFRHIADPGASLEVSGHYHPKARLPGRAAPCFLIDAARVVMPAYGAFTGGLPCDHPDLAALMRPEALAVLTGPSCLPRPMRL